MNEQKVTNLNDEEVKDLNPVFDLFVDRTQSLLERWQRFYATEAH